MCWLGQRPKNHLLSQNTELTDYKEICRVLTEWCKLKQNEIVSFTKLRDLRKDNLSLSEFINTAQLFVQECKYPLDSDRLLWDVTVSEVNPITAYKWCIDIGLDFSLEKATDICTADDSTRRQIESLKPYLAMKTQSAPALNSQQVHKFTARHSPRRSPKKHKFSESNNSKCY